MGLLRPATPGFLVTLIATILLGVVSFSVPWFKSVFFLKASLSVESINGSVTFGVLGYCLELSNGTTCSKASVGYELGLSQTSKTGEMSHRSPDRSQTSMPSSATRRPSKYPTSSSNG